MQPCAHKYAISSRNSCTSQYRDVLSCTECVFHPDAQECPDAVPLVSELQQVDHSFTATELQVGWLPFGLRLI